MEIDYELLKEIATQYVLEEELYINDSLSIETKQPVIVTTRHFKYLPEYNIKCFFEFLSLSDFDYDKFEISGPYEYLKSIKCSRISEGRTYDTFLGGIHNNRFYTVMYVYIVDFNKHVKENDHE